MALTPAELQARYRATLFQARELGFALSRESLERIQRALMDAQLRLLAEHQASTNPANQARIDRLRADVRAMLEGIRVATNSSVDWGLTQTAEGIATLHARAAMRLTKDAGLSSGAQARIVSRLDLVPARALATLNARRENAANFHTLVRRNIQGAAPALDRVISAGVVQGFSAARLAKDIGHILANGPNAMNVALYGLEPPAVTDLASVRSDARRIAVSEINNMHREANAEALWQSGIVLAAKWQVSGRHAGLPSTPDICDYLAQADLFGYGPGYYTPESWPHAGHPHCACTQGGPVIYRDPKDWASPRDSSGPRRWNPLDASDARQPQFVTHLSPKERARMLETASAIVPRTPVRKPGQRSVTQAPAPPAPPAPPSSAPGKPPAKAPKAPPAPKPRTFTPEPAPAFETAEMRATREGRNYRGARDAETGFTPAKTRAEAEAALTAVTGGATPVYEPVSELGSLQWNQFSGKIVGEKARRDWINEMNAELAWMRHEFPNMPRRIYDHIAVTSGKSGLSTTPDRVSAQSRQVMRSVDFDKPGFAERQAVFRNGRGHKFSTVEPGTSIPDATRHETAHGLTAAETRQEWNGMVRRLLKDGTIVSPKPLPLGAKNERQGWFTKKVSEYSATSDYEEIAEVFALVTRRGYVRGTLPAEMEAFVENRMLGGRRGSGYAGGHEWAHPRLNPNDPNTSTTSRRP